MEEKDLIVEFGQIVRQTRRYVGLNQRQLAQQVWNPADLLREALEPAEHDELWLGVRDAVVAVKAAYRPQGVNVGINLGQAAGAGVPGHLHVHVLPRWAGDTNFTTAIAEVRVLPEPLSDTWRKLRAAWPLGAGPH